MIVAVCASRADVWVGRDCGIDCGIECVDVDDDGDGVHLKTIPLLKIRSFGIATCAPIFFSFPCGTAN